MRGEKLFFASIIFEVRLRPWTITGMPALALCPLHCWGICPVRIGTLSPFQLRALR